MLPTNFTTLPIDNLTSTMSLLEVFVDDFIGCTDILPQNHILNITRAMLHGIHSVFPPQSVTNHNGGDPISEKKLDKLEGLWSHVKELLGWIIDGANYTICLPPEKVQKRTKSIKQIKKRNGVKLLEFQKIAGTLHHASMEFPGGRGLFPEIWSAMAKSKGGWVKITVSLQNIFDDFLWLFREIANKPINVAQLVPSLPDIHGYSDACKHGAGGVWIIPHGNEVRYIYWTCAFPSDITAQMETRELSINDLEMAGVLLEWLALEHLIPSMSNTQIGIQCDNTSTVHWTRKFTAWSLRAGHLLRAPSLGTFLEITNTLELHKNGIDPDLVGVHSLRAGGAMALKLQGVSDTTIKKQGRWTSMTFLQYIHNQIAHLSKDLSTKMSTNLTFINVASIEQY
jgi:hypothetical protein